MIRTAIGADLCRWDQNWKFHVPMFVRDTDALYREIYLGPALPIGNHYSVGLPPTARTPMSTTSPDCL